MGANLNSSHVFFKSNIENDFAIKNKLKIMAQGRFEHPTLGL